MRTPEQLEGLDALIIPGGESTTMTLGIEREGLAEPLREFVRSGKPTLGTCAGLIMLDRDHLGLLDVTARRNAFGRQRQASRPTSTSRTSTAARCARCSSARRGSRRREREWKCSQR